MTILQTVDLVAVALRSSEIPREVVEITHAMGFPDVVLNVVASKSLVFDRKLEKFFRIGYRHALNFPLVY